mgnify:CR=1 FL=1
MSVRVWHDHLHRFADDVIPDYFAETAENNIPKGYLVYYGPDGETPRSSEGGGYGSGARLFNFGAGGDFTKGLYFREGRVEYGSVEGCELALEAGKSYNIHFNTAMWKDNGGWMKFEIRNEADEIVYEELIQKYILDNTHGVIVSLEPEKGLNSKVVAIYNEKYGLLGSNKATEESIKLFPRECTDLVTAVQKNILEFLNGRQ